MIRRRFSALAAACLCAAATACGAHGQPSDNTAAYARPTVAGQSQGGAFFTLHNPTAQARILIAADSPVAERTELHTHINDKGVMRMRQVPSITVPAHGKAVLQPGGYHIMFFNLKQPLTVGQQFPLHLHFQDGSSQTLTVTVRPMNAAAHPHHH